MIFEGVRRRVRGVVTYFHKGVGEAVLCIVILISLMMGVFGLWVSDFSGYQQNHGPEIVLSVTQANAPLPNPLAAKYEPDSGCILGAYLDLDPSLKQTYLDQTNKVRRETAPFEKIIGRKHGMYFFYLGYGQPLPKDWIKKLDDAGKYVHIALEPNAGLDKVQKDKYLWGLVRDLRQTKAKIFLRFASEMNGPWVNYHGDPPKYREKFRLVADMVHKFAKNVAMVWCPLFTPVKPIPLYYPGDDAVDWVGVNIYNVTYFNQNAKQPGWDVTPQQMLKPIYDEYASRKPIMIAEYGVAHYSALESNLVRNFAIENIQSFYASLRLRFPRVKCINYFNCNNIQLQHRKNNDYRVTNDDAVRAAYSEAIASSYFLDSTTARDFSAAPQLDSQPWSENLKTDARLIVEADARLLPKAKRLDFFIDGKLLHSGIERENWALTIQTERLPVGHHQLLVVAYDAQGNELLRTKKAFGVRR